MTRKNVNILSFLIILFTFTINVFAMEETKKSYFSFVWNKNGDVGKDSSNVDKNSSKGCFLTCSNDDEQLCKTTKHLISHNHVKDLSEINKKIPASWLLISTDDKLLAFFKFVRELYTVKDIYEKLGEEKKEKEKEDVFLMRKKSYINNLINIFKHGREYDVIKEQSEKVFNELTLISNSLGKQIDVVNAKSKASNFKKRLNNNPGSIEDLAEDLEKEIEIYYKAGLDIKSLREFKDKNSKEMENWNQETDNKKNNPITKTLMEKIDVISQCDFLALLHNNWADITGKIKGYVNPFFEEQLSNQISNNIKTAFTPSIKKYITEFAEMQDAFNTVKKELDQIEKKTVNLVFTDKIEKEVFKKLVCAALASELNLESPDYQIEVRSVIKSELKGEKSEENSSKDIIKIDGNSYDIMNTYLSTFFPKAIQS
jgi:hypothetical protein